MWRFHNLSADGSNCLCAKCENWAIFPDKKFYIILALDTVKQGNIEEISKLAIQIISAETLQLISCQVETIRLNVLKHLELEASYSLWHFLTYFQIYFPKSLVVVLDDQISKDIKSHFLIEKALGKTSLHENIESYFGKWCSLTEVHRFIYQEDKNSDLSSLLRHYQVKEFKSGEMNCVQKCHIIHRLISAIESRNSNQKITLYPTHSMKWTVESMPKVIAPPHYIRPRVYRPKNLDPNCSKLDGGATHQSSI